MKNPLTHPANILKTTLSLSGPLYKMVNNTPLLPALTLLPRNRPAPRTSLPMPDQQLMQCILQMIRDPNFQMTKSHNFGDLSRV